MKAFIVLAACFVSCASAGHLGGYAAPSYAAPSYAAPSYSAPSAISTGTSTQFREEDTYGNYKFGYDESHATGRTGRREEKNGETVTGSYNLYDADGRDRTVHYIADHSGFRATIHTNEPGVDASRDPAAVLINKEGYAAVPAPEPVLVSAPAYRSAPAYAPAPLPAPLPAGPVKGYAFAAPAPAFAPAPAPAYAPAPAFAPAPAAYEAPARRDAFSYSFGTSHPSYAAPAPIYAAAAPAPAYSPAPLALPALPRQHGLKY